MVVDDVTIDLANWGLNAIKAQQTVTAKNIANANVKGYQAQKADFSSQLEILRSQTNASDLQSALNDMANEINVISETADVFSDQGVQLDKEIAKSTEQSLKYQALIQGLNHHFGMMKIAISGRK